MAEIVAAAWDVVREQGLAGLSMRDLGERVGMRAQSLYSYIESKSDIYDAMYHEGYRTFGAVMTEAITEDLLSTDPVRAAKAGARAFVEFCTDDPVRYQLLFQRTVPDFVPSPTSYSVAVEVYREMEERLAIIGIRGQENLDLWTAMLTGLTDQQISNDPGGDRWSRLVDRAVDMLLADIRSDSDERR